MIHSKKQTLFSVLALFSVIATALGSEPNQPEEQSGLKFEVSSKTFGHSSLVRSDSRIPRPRYAASLFMDKRPAAALARGLDPRRLIETSTGKTLSKEQQAFMISNRFSRDGVAGITEHDEAQSRYYLNLYAVSQDDARKMAESLMEYLNGFYNGRRNKNEERQSKTKAGLAKTGKLILEKQKLAEAAALDFQTLKNSPRYAFLKDAEAWKEAKATIAASNRTTDVLDIELAGITEKLKTIEKYRAASGEFSKAVHEKLEQMFVEQMVDLASAEARRRKALEIREQDGRFVKLFDEWDHLKFELNNLGRELKNQEHSLVQIERELADPQMVPPEVYQNKVTLHPVK